MSTQEKHQTLCRRESLTKSFLLRIPPEIFKPDRTGDRLCLSDWDSQDFKVSFFIEGADVWVLESSPFSSFTASWFHPYEKTTSKNEMACLGFSLTPYLGMSMHLSTCAVDSCVPTEDKRLNGTEDVTHQAWASRTALQASLWETTGCSLATVKALTSRSCVHRHLLSPTLTCLISNWKPVLFKNTPR